MDYHCKIHTGLAIGSLAQNEVIYCEGSFIHIYIRYISYTSKSHRSSKFQDRIFPRCWIFMEIWIYLMCLAIKQMHDV
jgi:hypothetical protein